MWQKTWMVLGVVGAVVIGLVLVAVLRGGANRPTANESTADLNRSSANKTIMTYTFPGRLPDEQITGKTAVITTEKGKIEFELFADEAPLTVSNFVYLASKGFYDGLTFHRVEPGFVIQGGDPLGDGRGGPGYAFPDEPVKRDYLAGTVAMANAGPNTNGSQFFIMLEDNLSLPKNYTIFGKVTGGLEAVKRIAVGDVMKTVRIQ